MPSESTKYCDWNKHAWVFVSEHHPAYREGWNTKRCAICDCHVGTRFEDSVASDPVNHPSHYTQYPVEVIEITERLGFLLGNVVKYVLRADYKGEPIQDLEKAEFYLRREISNRKKAQAE